MYKNRVETMIRENWVWTGSDHTLETVVTFGITETGEIVNFQVEKPSGDPSYDASIERAVKAVSPLPAPPEAYRNEFSQYELTFNAEFLQM
jgi:colicin import membrane protein